MNWITVFRKLRVWRSYVFSSRGCQVIGLVLSSAEAPRACLEPRQGQEAEGVFERSALPRISSELSTVLVHTSCAVDGGS